MIVPPLPRVPSIVTESPGRTERLITVSDLLIAVAGSSLTSTVVCTTPCSAVTTSVAGRAGQFGFGDLAVFAGVASRG